MKKIMLAGLAAVAIPAAASAQVTFNSDFSTSAGIQVFRTSDAFGAAGYNWAGEAVDASTGYTTVPLSPTGDTFGVKLEVNNNNYDGNPQPIANPTGNYAAGVTVWATTEPATSNYDIEANVFQAYTTPLNGGGTGSTEEFGFIIQGSPTGTTVSATRNGGLANASDVSSPLTQTDWASTATALGNNQRGLVFAMTGDSGNGGGSAVSPQSQVWVYNPNARDGNLGFANGLVGNWLVGPGLPYAYYSFETPADFPAVFYGSASLNSLINWPAGRIVADRTSPGYTWLRLKAAVRGNQVVFSVNGNNLVTYQSALTGKRVGFTFNDSFNSVSVPITQSYALIDNLKITEVVIVNSAKDWSLFE